MHIRRQWLHNIWWISKVEKNIQLWKLSELNSNLVTSLISVDSLTAFSSSQILQLVWMGMKDKETCTHTILTAVFFQVNQGYWRRRADMKGVTPLPCSGVLVVREKMRSSEWFLLVGDRKGIWPQKLCNNSPFFNMADKHSTYKHTCTMFTFVLHILPAINICNTLNRSKYCTEWCHVLSQLLGIQAFSKEFSNEYTAVISAR